MNCDQVFDVLTRGPFPTGDPSDASVERHLRGCEDCRRLAGALRPAVALLHEAVPVDESHDLPGYWGELWLRGGIDDVATTTTTTRAAVSPHRPASAAQAGSVGAVRLWKLAAALVLGVALGAALWSWDFPSPASTSEMAQSRANVWREYRADRIPATPSGQTMLAALSLSPECITTDAANDEPRHTPAQPPATFLCCSKCHTAAGTRLWSLATVATVSSSCQACHTN